MPRYGWSVLVGIIGGALVFGLIFPEFHAIFIAPDPTPFSEVEPLELPHPSTWVLLSAVIAALGTIFYPAQNPADAPLDRVRGRDIQQTRQFIAGAIFVCCILGLYLFFWVGWSLRITML